MLAPPAQVLPSASGQVLHPVKIPAIGQPLQAKASRCQQLRPCHQPAASGQRSSVSRSSGQPPCLRQQRKPCHRPALRPAAGDGGQVLPSASRSRRRPHGSRSVRCQQLSRLPVKQSAGWTSRQLRRSSNQPAGQVSSSGQPIGQRSAVSRSRRRPRGLASIKAGRLKWCLHHRFSPR